MIEDGRAVGVEGRIGIRKFTAHKPHQSGVQVRTGRKVRRPSFMTVLVTGASWVRVGSHYSWWDCTRARENLLLGQRPLEESIADAIKWFEKNGYLKIRP
jgi:hypothetical protein